MFVLSRPPAEDSNITVWVNGEEVEFTYHDGIVTLNEPARKVPSEGLGAYVERLFGAAIGNPNMGYESTITILYGEPYLPGMNKPAIDYFDGLEEE